MSANLIQHFRLGTLLAAVFALTLIAACQRQDSATSGARRDGIAARADANALDRSTADERQARIENLDYDLYVDIASNSDEFSGEVTLRFDLADATSDLTVDFAGGVVNSIRVNDAAIDAKYNGNFITISADDLEAGPTEIRIAYRHPFSRDGNGLHRFVDPEDGLTYLYTYLWPYYANRLLPSFDQPNLKAHFSLRVRAPEGWTVISAAPGSPAVAADGTALWTFERTPRIATYMFSLHAGPYQVWRSEAGNVPLRLLARRSIAEFVAVEEWFEITRRGMEFYGRYFEIPYPFAKYDQLIAPESTIGGMENVAAVTFGEQFVQRQASDRTQRESRANVILHELAHMWFGDLVTHDWWNGMWLNESFATQMAVLSQLEVTEFTDKWHGFFTHGKQSAYARDSRVTTHPIEMPVDSTDQFHTVWDAITYQKGASVLKQLRYYVGADNYRRGVSAYLKENAWGNTELSDFIGHQEKSADLGLADWTAEWLLQPGFNTLRAETECDGERLRSISILQSAPAEHPILRTHRVEVALYDLQPGGALVATDVLPVQIAGARTAVAVHGERPCPVIVNPNFDDWTYARIELSGGDVRVLAERLGDMVDPLSRSMFLAALFDRAKHGDMPLADYADHALRLAEHEQNIRVLEQITASIVETVDLMQRLRPETDAALARLLGDIESLALQRAQFAEARDLKYMWLNMFLGVVSSPAGLGTARALLDGQADIAGVDVSPEIRWKLLIILSRNGAPESAELVEAERTRDPSDFGTKRWLSAQAAIPDPAVKAEWVAELQNPDSVTGLSRQRAVMAELFPASQTGLQLLFLEDIVAAMPGLGRHADSYFLSSYAQALLTPMCRRESVALMRAALDVYGDQLDATTLRFLREAHQADTECLALRALQ